MFLDDGVALTGMSRLVVELERSTGSLAITSKSQHTAQERHALMQLSSCLAGVGEPLHATLEARASSLDYRIGEAFYAATGNDYRGEFRALKEAWALPQTKALGRVEYDAEETERPHLRACAYLDACTHTSVFWLDHRRRGFFAAAIGAYHVLEVGQKGHRVLWTAVGRAEHADAAAQMDGAGSATSRRGRKQKHN